MTKLGKDLIQAAHEARAIARGESALGRTSVRWLDLYKTFATLIKEDYGPRCPEVEGGCPVCQMWALYDLLVASVCADDDEEESNDQVGKDLPGSA